MTDDLVDDRSSTDWQINDSNTTVWREDVRVPADAGGSTLYPEIVTSWNTRTDVVMPLYGDYEASLVSIDPPISDTRPWTDVHAFLAGISQQIDDRSIWVGTSPAPGIPHQGDLWWNSTDGNLYIYYQDINSAAWVPAMSLSSVFLSLAGGTLEGDLFVTGKLSITGTYSKPFLLRATNLWEDDAGAVRFKHGTPLNDLDGTLAFAGAGAAADATAALAAAAAAQVTADAALPKAGGVMTGPIVLAGPPAGPLQPATKTYTDTADTANASAAATADSKAVAAQSAATAAATTANAALPKAGGTMTGPIVLAADATAPLQPVTKQQLDASVASLVIPVSVSPPAAPADGSLWWDPTAGILYVRYNDGNSTAWVPAVRGGL